MDKQRRHFAAAEKVAILKRHLVDKVPISDLCDELGLYPNLLYTWLKEFFENGHRADGRASATAPLERQADEAEFALSDQRLEIAQTFDVRDVELEAGLVHERVDVAHRARAHGVDAEMHDALACQPLGRRDVDAGIVG